MNECRDAVVLLPLLNDEFDLITRLISVIATSQATKPDGVCLLGVRVRLRLAGMERHLGKESVGRNVSIRPRLTLESVFGAVNFFRRSSQKN